MLFCGEGISNLEECIQCKGPRYKNVDNSKVPMKVLRYFSLKARLQRCMFATPLQASFQTWYMANKSIDGLVRVIADSLQWQGIDKSDPSFTVEHQNLCLGLATDGMNPFSIKRSTWSTWPILLFNYNIPPWMTTKQHFIMLSMIIPNPQSSTSSDFDIFLKPLLEGLIKLWDVGVDTHDALGYEGSQYFKLRVILMWTMHDFSAHGIVFDLVTKGYLDCPICGLGTKSWRSSALAKNMWDCMHRKYLSVGHMWRMQECFYLFNGQAEHGLLLTRITLAQHI